MNKKNGKYLIITSINEPNEALRKFASLTDWNLIVVGDNKSPATMDVDNLYFLDVHKQKELSYKYYAECPENHYSRKNMGYLFAIQNGASIIAESDDDNIPGDNWGDDVLFTYDELDIIEDTKFYNAYKHFTKKHIWPRGYPLENIIEEGTYNSVKKPVEIGVWQYLADNEADVDAIYRLTINEPVTFDSNYPIALQKHVFCPFNTQNTFWNKKAYPYLYLPKTVTFRFTDILRGYVVQRLLWEDDLLLGFGGATVWQDRNFHNFMIDFKDEIPMYTGIMKLVEVLDAVRLPGNPTDNLFTLYETLYKHDFVKKEELDGVKLWIKDLEAFGIK